MAIDLEDRLRRYAGTLDDAIAQAGPLVPAGRAPAGPPRRTRALLAAAMVLVAAMAVGALALVARDDSSDLAAGRWVPDVRLGVDPDSELWRMALMRWPGHPRPVPTSPLGIEGYSINYADPWQSGRISVSLSLSVYQYPPDVDRPSLEQLWNAGGVRWVTVRDRPGLVRDGYDGQVDLEWWETDDVMVHLVLHEGGSSGPGGMEATGAPLVPVTTEAILAVAEGLVQLSVEEWTAMQVYVEEQYARIDDNDSGPATTMLRGSDSGPVTSAVP